MSYCLRKSGSHSKPGGREELWEVGHWGLAGSSVHLPGSGTFTSGFIESPCWTLPPASKGGASPPPFYVPKGKDSENLAPVTRSPDWVLDLNPALPGLTLPPQSVSLVRQPEPVGFFL